MLKNKEVGNFLCSLHNAKARGEAERCHAGLVAGPAVGICTHWHWAKLSSVVAVPLRACALTASVLPSD